MTPETLTDAMIREEWARALDSGEREAAQVAQVALGTWTGAHEWRSTKRARIPACDLCGAGPGNQLHVHVARRRIADAINARTGVKP